MAGGRDSQTSTYVRRAVIAATIGTTVEYYDFGLYNQASALYLGRLFFPGRDAFVAAVAAFGTLLIGQAFRPLGAILFGHLGDRLGRKTMLVVTLVLMGSATTLIGLVPPYAVIGIWGALILTLLRILQSMGAAGEWSGSVLITTEWGHRGRRGFLGSFTQAGLSAGLALSFVALQVSTALLGRNSYWGWRAPFLVSVVLVLVGLYVRLRVLETPVFRSLVRERQIERWPVARTVQRDWRQVLLCVLLRAGSAAPAIIFSTFVLAYATSIVHLKQANVLTFVIISTAISALITAILFGWLSDVIGRKRMYILGAIAVLLFSFPYWALIDTKLLPLVGLAIVLSFPIQDSMNGPQAAFIAETFTGSRRYSGSALGFQLAAGLWGGTAPIVALTLVHAFKGSWPVAVYMMATVVVSIIAALLLRDRTKADIGPEYGTQVPEASSAGVSAPAIS